MSVTQTNHAVTNHATASSEIGTGILMASAASKGGVSVSQAQNVSLIG